VFVGCRSVCVGLCVCVCACVFVCVGVFVLVGGWWCLVTCVDVQCVCVVLGHMAGVHKSVGVVSL